MEIKSEMEPEIVFGQLYQFIQDETVEEIWINSPERIFVARAGRSELTNVILTAIEVRDLVDRALIWGGRRLDLSHPFVDARLPDGSRLHVTIPEITAEHWAVNIRKHIAQIKSLEQLKDEGVLTEQIMQLLIGAVNAGMNILVSGATQAGKTTLLNALASEISFSQRVITIEEVFEIRPRIPDVIQMQTRSANLQGVGEISLRRLVKEALRMRPNRLIVGEVREAEALDLLIALNSGLPGMGTIHANSARDAVMKLQTLPLLAGSNISHSFIVPTVASAIDLVVHMALLSDGQRRVQEILEVTGRYESLHIEMESLWRVEEGRYVPGIGLSSFSERIGLTCEE
jgi:pilus assembly protein CpaF